MRTRKLLLPLLATLATVAGAGASTALAAPDGPAATIEVSTAAELKAALGDAAPGDTIHLADGTYTGNFKAATAATPTAPITLTGSARAVLTAGSGYGLHLYGASHWTVEGITVTGGQKGIVIDSAVGVVRNSTIYDTGHDGRGMGEGVYVGTANTLDDRSDGVRILDNVIGPGVGGENVDIKEGTTGAVVSGNTFDGSGLTGANYDDSWVDVKGNGVVVENNKGTHTSNDGYQTHTQQDGWGCGSVFRGNTSDLRDAQGPDQLAIHVANQSDDCRTTVYAGNTVTGGKGLTNVDVTN